MGPWFSLGRVRGVLVRIHWSAPFGAFFFGGRTWSGALAWLVVVLVHEGGHALLARRFGSGVSAVQVHAIGGECLWSPGPHRWAREIVAWGGVLGQLALFGAVATVDAVAPLAPMIGQSALAVLTVYNLAMAAFNLLPFGNLDGRRAWGLLAALHPRHVRARVERGRLDGDWGESKAFRKKLESMRGTGPYKRD
jgi:Zn-dependent protease